MNRIITAAVALAIFVSMANQGLAKVAELIEGVTTTQAPMTSGYSREAFGSGWIDADRDCLDTRQEILVRDGRNVKVSDCRVVSGVWVDPYTGKRITNPRGVDIDHTYPLAEAWRQGAGKWTAQKRIAFANDPRNLVASSAHANRSKSDQNINEWCVQGATERVANECPLSGAKTNFHRRYNKVAAAYGLK